MSQVSKAKKIQAGSWSDLPHDILNLIVDRLYYADQIRFRLVCKGWKSIYGDKYADKLPWLMEYKWYKNEILDIVTFECDLYDPSHMQKYTIKHNIREKEREIFDGAKVYASKYGWLLFSKAQYIKPALFFYTPFGNNEIMKLPKLCTFGLKAATFCRSPTSLDCVICALSIDNQKLYVSTCSPRDKTWSTCQFDGFNNKDTVENMVFVDGTFYWYFRSGVLGAFNIALQELNIYMCPVRKDDAGFGHLVESDEHILTAYCVKNRILNQEDSVSFQWKIFKFDQLRKNWIEVESLGNPLLALNSTLLSIPAEEGASKLGNTIPAPINGLQLYDWIKDIGWLELNWIHPPRSKA